MPDLPAQPRSPFFPAGSAPAQTTQAGQSIARRLPPELEDLQRQVSSTVLDIAGRVKLLEQRFDNLRSHLELLDGSMIEKHKSVVSEIRDAQDGMRSLRADIDGLKDLTERIAKRMDALATKEEVKVLERYVELWQPMQFVTRSEVKGIVQNVLKEQGFKIKEKAKEKGGD